MADLVEWKIEIDQDVYDGAYKVFAELGTTIEEMTVAFIRFFVEPENLPLLLDYCGKKDAPTETRARDAVFQEIFSKVYAIATKRVD